MGARTKYQELLCSAMAAQLMAEVGAFLFYCCMCVAKASLWDKKG